MLKLRQRQYNGTYNYPRSSESDLAVVLGSMVFSPHQEMTGETLLDEFFAADGNAIDTAHAYGGGDSERVIGAWMETHNNRAEVFLIDKGAHPTPQVPRPRLNPQEIKCDLEESLDRLQTDYIDLYLLHRDESADSGSHDY